MIQKIQNLDLEKTDDQLEIEWAQTLSRRNKLLEISDWTQLADVYLIAEDRRQWSLWRQKLRKVSRKVFKDIEEAKKVLTLIESEMPKTSCLDEAEFNDRVLNLEISGNKVTEKVITKQQDIIIHEEISTGHFRELLHTILDNEAYEFKNYLLSFLAVENTNIFTEEDTLEDCKNKAKAFTRTRQTVTLNKKLAYHPDPRIIAQRSEEAIDFLSSKVPDLESFPLIQLHSEYTGMTHEKTALNFLQEKKWYNQLLLETEKFLFYTGQQIDAATTKAQIQSIIESIKNGY